MRTRVLVALFASLLVANHIRAENITWISLNQVDAVDPADHEFTDILTGAGHDVTRFFFDGGTVLSQDVIDDFNASDLVIIGKASNSGDYDDDSLIFNESITSPLLLMSGYISRMNRFGWVTGNGLVDTVGPSQLVAEDPAHPVFKGVEFEGDGVTTLNPYNFQIDRGISTATDPPIAGGSIIATSVEIANGLVAAEWPAGTAVITDDGTFPNQTLAGDRYLFLGGSREADGNPIQTSTLDLTPDGKRMYFNMVHYALGGDVPDPADFNRDGVVDETDYMTLGNNIFGHLDGPVGFINGDMDLDFDVDVEDFGLFKAAYPAVVAAAQGVPEPSTFALLAALVVTAGIARVRRGRIGGSLLSGLLAVVGGILLAGSPAFAQFETFWTPTGSDDYNGFSNWSGGAPPDVNFPANEGEIGVVTNGGTAVLNSAAITPAGAIILGQAAGEVGTLEIQSGGDLTVDPTNLPDGSVAVGLEGEGHLTVLRGGMLTADALSSGGAMGSAIVLGETGGSGTATVTVNGAVNLQRTTRIIGPDVSFGGGNLTLGDSHTLVAQITGPTHSAITASTATLGGSVEIEFDGVTPSIGDAWTLVDANFIGGAINSVTTTGFTPDPGFGVTVDVGPGGVNGQVAAVTYDARLQLTVDPDTGDAALQNLTTTETFDFDGYGITSLDGTLTPGGWTSIAGGDPTWTEFNPASNHLSELNLFSSRSLGPESSIFLGPIFAPPGAGGTLDNVGFTYHNTGGSAVQGLLAIGDLDVIPPPPMGIPGDYNDNGQVEQGDLDLVLLNWGQPGVPDGWTNDLPMGNIDQAELDGVLLNWGNMAAAGLSGAAGVPEPASWLLVALGVCAVPAVRRPFRGKSRCRQPR